MDDRYYLSYTGSRSRGSSYLVYASSTVPFKRDKHGTLRRDVRDSSICFGCIEKVKGQWVAYPRTSKGFAAKPFEGPKPSREAACDALVAYLEGNAAGKQRLERAGFC